MFDVQGAGQLPDALLHLNRVAPQPGSRRDRLRGCLLGGALGDALGAPVEFLGDREIAARRASGRLFELSESYGVLGGVTDDTQMTLWTVEGLIRARVHGQTRGRAHPPSWVHAAYLRWLATQGGVSSLEVGGGWLEEHGALEGRRAPGNTCLSALFAATALGTPADNASKGCGGVMRVAPCGFVEIRPLRAFELGADCARLTHGHPSGWLSAGALSAMLCRVFRGESLEDAAVAGHRDLLEVEERLRQGRWAVLGQPVQGTTDEVLTETSEALASVWSEAARADAEGVPPRIPEALGEGWVGDEALAIGLYSALVGRTFEEAMVLAIGHRGDSDSTGSVCGQLLGAAGGEAALPSLAYEVEHADLCLLLADALAGVLDGDLDAAELAEAFPP